MNVPVFSTVIHDYWFIILSYIQYMYFTPSNPHTLTPSQGESCSPHVLHWCDQPLQLSSTNIHRLITGLCPSSWEELEGLFYRGYNDALRFFRLEGVRVCVRAYYLHRHYWMFIISYFISHWYFNHIHDCELWGMLDHTCPPVYIQNPWEWRLKSR